jgi:hypothetical protein
MRMLPALIIGLSTLPGSVSAHHAGAALYDPAKTAEIAGEVTRVFWRNPHVHFLIDGTDTNGRAVQWDVETNSVSILSRMGLTADAVGVGDSVRIAGWPGRGGEPRLFATNLLLPGKQEILLNPTSPPRWSDDTLGDAVVWTSDGKASDDSRLRGLFRVWSTNMKNPASFPLFHDLAGAVGDNPLTAAARAARAAWDPQKDNPYLGCTPMGMPRVMGQPYPIQFVDEGDEILLRIELYDIERRIVMNENTAEAPVDVPRSPLGRSFGRWEGDALIVTTTGISWPYFDQSGVPLGRDAEITERFEPSADGSRLNYTLTVIDPATFTAPVTLHKYWTWRRGERIQPFDCTEFQEPRRSTRR